MHPWQNKYETQKQAALDFSANFFSGNYQEILSSIEGLKTNVFHPFVVGSLCLTGRLDEAVTAASISLSGKSDFSEEDRTAIRFFLTIGYCHAGRLQDAMRQARRNLRYSHLQNDVARFYVAQGLGMVRYFEGRMVNATRFAKEALRAAMSSGFTYGRLLALDLRGHTLVQKGEFFAGLRLLGQAQKLASDMNALSNAETIAASIATYKVGRMAEKDDAKISELENCLSLPQIGYFSKRNGLYQLASRFALEGSCKKAQEVLAISSNIALPDGDTRGRLRRLLAQIIITSVRDNNAQTASLQEAWRLAQGDPALESEIVFTAAIIGFRDSNGFLKTANLFSLTSIQRVQVAEMITSNRKNEKLPFEDTFAEFIVGLSSGTLSEKVKKLCTNGLLGLLPRTLGVLPGRRIIVNQQDMVLENYGEFHYSKLLGGPSLRLLQSIAKEPGTKEELLRRVWNIQKYVPHLHDATLHTAVTRLRRSLQPNNDWIITTQRGYALDAEVQFVELEQEDSLGKNIDIAVTSVPMSRSEKVFQSLDEHGAASCTDIAVLLGISKASALRVLKGLLEQQKVQRVGQGKSTRYELVLNENR